MPFKSQAQHRKFRSMEAEGALPKGTSSEWAHHTPGGLKKLPNYAKKAADLSTITKAASAFNIQPGDVALLGQALGTDAADMASAALADPASFTQLLKFAADGTLRANAASLRPQVEEGTPMTNKFAAVLPAMQQLKKARDRQTVEKIAADRMRKLLIKKAREVYRRSMVDYLDGVAAKLPLEKQASVRTVQAGIARGLTIHDSLKLAFDDMTDFEMGTLAAGMVRLAALHQKRANAAMGYGPGAATGAGTGAAINTTGPLSMTGPAASAGAMMGKMAAAPAPAPAQQQAPGSAGMAGLFGAGGATMGGLLGALLSKGRAGRAMGSMGRTAPLLGVGAGGAAGVHVGKGVAQSKPMQGVNQLGQAMGGQK